MKKITFISSLLLILIFITNHLFAQISERKLPTNGITLSKEDGLWIVFFG